MTAKEKSSRKANLAMVKKSRLYQLFSAERKEILKHKWLQSEKAGKDIGFEFALVDWYRHHRSMWRKSNAKELH